VPTVHNTRGAGQLSLGCLRKGIFAIVPGIQLAVKGNTSSFNIPAGWALTSIADLNQGVG
jgi:hypothetical protein